MRRRLERHGLWHGDHNELDIFSRVQARGADQVAARKALVRDGGRARRASFSQLALVPSMRHPAAHGTCAAVDAAELDEASARLKKLARVAASELPAAYAKAGLRGGREEVGPPYPRPSSACVASHAARAAAAVVAAGTSASRAVQRPSSACASSRRSSSVPLLTQSASGPTAVAALPSATALAPADEAGEQVRGAPSEQGNPLEWASRREVQRLKAALRLASGASLTHGAAARLEAAERSDANVAAAAERHVAQQKLAVQQRAAANRAMVAVKQSARPVVVGSRASTAEDEAASSESLLRSLMATLSAASGDGDAGVPHPRKAEAEGTELELEVSIRDAPPSVATTVFQ